MPNDKKRKLSHLKQQQTITKIASTNKRQSGNTQKNVSHSDSTKCLESYENKTTTSTNTDPGPSLSTTPQSKQKQTEKGETSQVSETEGGNTRNGSSGKDYHLNLTLNLYLGTFHAHRKPKPLSIKLTQEDCIRGGKFDDIVCQFDSPGSETINIYIQAKYNENPQHEKSKITEKKLLDTAGTYSIERYFFSYLQLCLDRITKNRNDENLHVFMLCTSAQLHEEVELPKKDLDENHYNAAIKSFCTTIGAQCFTFMNNQLSSQYLTKLQLLEKLQKASLRELAILLFTDPQKDEEKKVKDALLEVYKYLIAHCVGKNKDRLDFDEVFNDPGNNSKALNILNRAAKEVKTNTPRLKTAKKSIPVVHDEKECFKEDECFKVINTVIDFFCKEFVLLSSTKNITELNDNAIQLIPTWVENKEKMKIILKDNVEAAMKGGSLTIDKLKNCFVDSGHGKHYAQSKDSSDKYEDTLKSESSDLFEIDRKVIIKSGLYNFLNGSASNSNLVYQYHSHMNVKLSSLVVRQTLKSIGRECLFVGFTNEHQLETITCDDLKNVMHFMFDTDIKLKKTIVVIGQLNDIEMKNVAQYAKNFKMKVVGIGHSKEENESNLKFCHLSDKSKKMIKNKKSTLGHTLTPLAEVIEIDDDLNYVDKILHLKNSKK